MLGGSYGDAMHGEAEAEKYCTTTDSAKTDMARKWEGREVMSLAGECCCRKSVKSDGSL